VIRRRVALGVLGVVAIAPVAGCGPERLSSLPVQAPGREVTATPSLAATAPPTTEVAVPPAGGGAPPRRKRPRPIEPPAVESTPPPGPSCENARDFDLTDEALELPGAMCFQIGGVLKLHGVEAGVVSAEPAELVDTQWEGGVQSVVFRDPGTVSVTVPRGEQTHTILVEVIALPSPA
jgi:hypothetical protein